MKLRLSKVGEPKVEDGAVDWYIPIMAPLTLDKSKRQIPYGCRQYWI